MPENSRDNSTDRLNSNGLSNSTPQTFAWVNQRYVAIGAMIIGLGMILLDLGTGVITASLSTPVKLLTYIPGILLSVWGMKQILTLEAEVADGRSRKVWRLPSEGVAYILIFGIMFLASIIGRSNPLMLVFSMMAGPFIINGSITLSMTRNVTTKRKVPPRVMTNEPVNISLTVENHKWVIPSCVLTVHDQLESSRERVQASVVFLFIMPGKAQTAQYLLKLANRGVYKFQSLTVLTRFPLGIVERGLSTTQADTIFVYPQIGRLAHSWKQKLMGGEFLTTTVRNRNSVFNDEFHSIREYRQGDDYRTIHWPSSARRNELMVREFEESRDPHLTIILDLTDHPSAESTTSDNLEHAISFATTIAVEHAQQCSVDRLSFVCIGDQSWSWHGERTSAITELLDQLAQAQHSRQLSAQDFISQAEQSLDHHTSRILIISLRETELTEALQKRNSQLQQTPEHDSDTATLMTAQLHKTSQIQAAIVLSGMPENTSGLFTLDS